MLSLNNNLFKSSSFYIYISTYKISKKRYELCLVLYQGNVDGVKNLDNNILWWKFTFSIFFGVWICYLSFKAIIIFDVFEDLEWQPFVAAIIIKSLGAVYKLLLRQRNSFHKCLCIGCLESSSGAATNYNFFVSDFR